MKRQDFFYAALLLLAILPAGYFSIRAGCALSDYYSRSETTKARVLRWEIQETKGKFPITAVYSFEAKGGKWSGSTRLGQPWHLNEPAAAAALQRLAKQPWSAWYNPGNPSDSSLEREFPSGLVVRTIICYGVIGYFLVFLRKVIRNILN